MYTSPPRSQSRPDTRFRVRVQGLGFRLLPFSATRTLYLRCSMLVGSGIKRLKRSVDFDRSPHHPLKLKPSLLDLEWSAIL